MEDTKFETACSLGQKTRPKLTPQNSSVTAEEGTVGGEPAEGNQGQNRDKPEPRPLLVKLKTSKIMWAILKNAKNLKHTKVLEFTKVSIAPDLTWKEREANEVLRLAPREKRGKGKEAWYIRREELLRKSFRLIASTS